MDSVRQGLRQGTIERGTWDKLQCSECEAQLSPIDDPEELGSVKQCPECGTSWREM